MREKYSDTDIDAISSEMLKDARREVESRREMRSGQVKKTLWGEMKFVLIVDLPADMPEDNFKKYMAEYGGILQEAFTNG